MSVYIYMYIYVCLEKAYYSTSREPNLRKRQGGKGVRDERRVQGRGGERG